MAELGMSKLRVPAQRMGGKHRAAGSARAGRALAAAVVLAMAGCGGGGSASDDLQAMASSAVGGQAMPTAVSIQTTHRALDLAIDGGGAFVLRDPQTGTQLLSRLGHFDIDALGRLINDEGWLVAGVSASALAGVAEGQLPASLAELALLPPIRTLLPPLATRQVLIEANLPSSASILGGGSAAADPIDPNDATTYNHSTSITAYDALGQPVALTLYFRKQAKSVWWVYLCANGLAVNPGANGQPQPIAQMRFRPDGVLPIDPSDASRPLPPVVIDIPATAEAGGRSTEAIAAVEINLSTMSQFGAPFAPTLLQQDGAPAARLSSASIKTTGELVLGYTDGRVDASRRLVLARTSVADRLHPYGASGWICGTGCQSPLLAWPGQMLTGTLLSGALNTGS